MPTRRKFKSRTVAPACVYFTKAKNPAGQNQLCVYAECTYGGAKAGPIWGHAAQSVSKCLATLTQKCDCGRSYHKHKFTEGFRVIAKNKA